MANGVNIKEARTQLGQLVDLAYWKQQITVIHRNGAPSAMIAPLPKGYGRKGPPGSRPDHGKPKVVNHPVTSTQ